MTMIEELDAVIVRSKRARVAFYWYSKYHSTEKAREHLDQTDEAFAKTLREFLIKILGPAKEATTTRDPSIKGDTMTMSEELDSVIALANRISRCQRDCDHESIFSDPGPSYKRLSEATEEFTKIRSAFLAKYDITPRP